MNDEFVRILYLLINTVEPEAKRNIKNLNISIGNLKANYGYRKRWSYETYTDKQIKDRLNKQEKYNTMLNCTEYLRNMLIMNGFKDEK